MLSLIVGLGNPGIQYTQTRHNVGFRVLDLLARKMEIHWSHKRALSAHVGKGVIEDKSVVLLKPTTYMNCSGHSVQAASHYFKISLDQVLVLHDDIDLAIGRIQIRQGGGHAGHRGLQSVIEALGSSDFIRIRLGIKNPDSPCRGTDFVLGTFGDGEKPLVDQLVERGGQTIEVWLKYGLVHAMNQFNPWPTPHPKEELS